MKEAGYESVELEFSREEIDELKNMQLEYEKRIDQERKEKQKEARKKQQAKEQAEMLQRFWNDPKQTKLD